MVSTSSLFIERKAGEIIYLVASACLSIRLFAGVLLHEPFDLNYLPLPVRGLCLCLDDQFLFRQVGCWQSIMLLISAKKDLYPFMTGSLQSSTLILCVLSSRRVCATFIGASLSMIAFRSNAMALSMSAISLLVYETKKDKCKGPVVRNIMTHEITTFHIFKSVNNACDFVFSIRLKYSCTKNNTFCRWP